MFWVPQTLLAVYSVVFSFFRLPSRLPQISLISLSSFHFSYRSSLNISFFKRSNKFSLTTAFIRLPFRVFKVELTTTSLFISSSSHSWGEDKLEAKSESYLPWVPEIFLAPFPVSVILFDDFLFLSFNDFFFHVAVERILWYVYSP